METKLIAGKAKSYDLTRMIASRGSKEKENVLRNIHDPNMPINEKSSRIEQRTKIHGYRQPTNGYRMSR